MGTFKAKPVEVEAFTYGVDNQPSWFLQAVRQKKFKVIPVKGFVITKTSYGQFNVYDPKTFSALFESTESAEDINKDGVLDSREKAIASETKQKKATRSKPKPKPE